ncbi:ferredoxin reductase [Echria macrotheca]|uniref:Ferredoxin reductase n=1 Tax=Echria macrotheca TaxID=438768 RepID=A0AAJ0F7B9_9PEZI|nr:ferredoxin reductase [Echria macrotheca]
MQPLHYAFRPVISDQHTAARAYFLCVLAMLFIESMLRVPTYLLSLWKRGNVTPRRSRPHWAPYVWLHSFLVRPSPAPVLTDHHVALLIRCLVFIGLNVLFGWNRIRYSTDYQIYGWLTIANGGLALLLPTRGTNLFSLVARIPAPILLAYHRWAGVATVVHASMHFGLTVTNYVATNQFDVVVQNTRIRIGIMAWTALALIFLTSLRIVRRRAFEVFAYTHFLFLVFVAGGLYHAAYGPEFLLPGLILWALDRFWRLCYSFKVRQIRVRSITHYPAAFGGDVVKIQLEGRGVAASLPAQMAWIQIPGLSALNWHPFTIASPPEDHQTATFAIRGLGGYTKEIHKVAGQEGMMDSAALKIRVDGPYGVGRLQWARYPIVALVAGGIGITPAISIASHMVKRAVGKPSPHTAGGQWRVYLLWTVGDIRDVRWFVPELKELAALTSRPDVPVTLSVLIHVTDRRKKAGNDDVGRWEYEMEEEQTMEYSGPGDIMQGRPDIVEWVKNIREKNPGLDVAMSVCGPQPLKNAGRTAAARASNRDGLVFVEEEVFEF